MVCQRFIQRITAKLAAFGHLFNDIRVGRLVKSSPVIDDLAYRARERGLGKPAPLKKDTVVRRVWCRLQCPVAVALQNVLQHGAGFENLQLAVAQHRHFAYRV